MCVCVRITLQLTGRERITAENVPEDALHVVQEMVKGEANAQRGLMESVIKLVRTSAVRETLEREIVHLY